VYAVLVIAVFYLGYYVFLQGPLAIIDYVMFPVMAHFLNLGEIIATRSKNLWEALHAAEPWRQWAGLEAKADHKH
jgi:hypothetical protein